MFIPMNTLNMPKNPTQRWEWIKYQLRAKGLSLASLSRELGVTRNALNNVKRTPYPRMERAIASRLDLQPITLWPERWNADGSPKRLRPRHAEARGINALQSNEAAALTHCQAAGAH